VKVATRFFILFRAGGEGVVEKGSAREQTVQSVGEIPRRA